VTKVTSRTTKVLVSTIVAVRTFSSASWKTEVLLPWWRALVKNSRFGGRQPEKLGCRQLTVWRMAQPRAWRLGRSTTEVSGPRYRGLGLGVQSSPLVRMSDAWLSVTPIAIPKSSPPATWPKLEQHWKYQLVKQKWKESVISFYWFTGPQSHGLCYIVEWKRRHLQLFLMRLRPAGVWMDDMSTAWEVTPYLSVTSFALFLWYI